MQVLTKLKPTDPYDQKIPLRISAVVLELLKNDATRSTVSTSHLQQISSWVLQNSATFAPAQHHTMADLLTQMKGLVLSNEQVGK